MKDFTQLTRKTPAPVVSQQDKQDKEFFVKRSLARSIDKAPEIQEAVLQWLMSFQGAISKEQFTKQICKLSNKDSEALSQLDKSKGRRVLQNVPREKPPKLPAPLLDVLAKYHSVAVEAAAGRKAIEQSLATLPPSGIYILDVNELILEYTDYKHRGRAGEIIDAAHKASILVLEGLEKPIALAYHIKDTLFQLASVRRKDPDKYTLSTWNYTHKWYIPEYIEYFTLFSV